MIASASKLSISESDVPEDLRILIGKFLAAKTPHEIDTLIEEADKGYDKLSNDTKYVVAQLVPLRSMRGFIFHVRPLAQKAAMTDGALISVAKSFQAAVSVYFPKSKGQLLLDYLETPADNAIWAFNTDSQMQNYLLGPVFNHLVTARNRLATLKFDQRRVIWDNKLVAGEDSFLDNIDRFRFIGEAERNAALANLDSAKTNLYILGSYSIDGLFSLYDYIGQTIGYGAVATAFGGSLSGATADDRVRIVTQIRKTKPNFLKLLPDNKQTEGSSACTEYRCATATARMQTAFQFFKDGVKSAHLAWSELKNSSDDLWAALDPGFFRPFTRANQETFKNLDRMVTGREVFTSAITKEVVTVDLPALFNDPPEDLAKFMPTRFKKGKEFVAKRTPTGGTYHLRDYSVGQGNAWDYRFYQKYFPSVTNSEQVKQAAQTIAQVWGGGIIGLPMSIFFF
jgi:hypothetical protein